MTKTAKQPLFFSMTGDFLNICLAGTASPQTVDGYRDALTVFRRYVCDVRGIPLRRFTFSDCTFDFVLDFRNWILGEEGLAPATANHRLAAINAYLRYAAGRDIAMEQTRIAVAKVPAARNPVKMRPIIEDEEALRALLDAPPNTRTGRRDMLILAILFDAALRVEELTGLRLKDICLTSEAPHLLIHGKGRRERIVPVCAGTVCLLKAHLEEFHPEPQDEAPLIYTTIHGSRCRMSERNVERIVKKYADAVRPCRPGIPDQVYPHLLRRTRATLMYRSGTPVEMIALFLGHASIQTTMDHYASPSLEQKKIAAEQGGTLSVQSSQPEWPEDDDEFARMCGLR